MYTCRGLLDLGIAAEKTGSLNQAESFYKDAVHLAEKDHRSEKSALPISLLHLFELYEKLERWPDAESALRRVLKIYERVYGIDSVAVLVTLGRLAEVCYREGKVDESIHLKALTTMGCNGLAETHVRASA